jgi:hypothetical protein
MAKTQTIEQRIAELEAAIEKIRQETWKAGQTLPKLAARHCADPAGPETLMTKGLENAETLGLVESIVRGGKCRRCRAAEMVFSRRRSHHPVGGCLPSGWQAGRSRA